jgi:hypothetical protein
MNMEVICVAVTSGTLLLPVNVFYREELYLKGSEIFNVFAINLFSFSIFIEYCEFPFLTNKLYILLSYGYITL